MPLRAVALWPLSYGSRSVQVSGKGSRSDLDGYRKILRSSRTDKWMFALSIHKNWW